MKVLLWIFRLFVLGLSWYGFNFFWAISKVRAEVGLMLAILSVWSCVVQAYLWALKDRLREVEMATLILKAQLKPNEREIPSFFDIGNTENFAKGSVVFYRDEHYRPRGDIVIPLHSVVTFSVISGEGRKAFFYVVMRETVLKDGHQCVSVPVMAAIPGSESNLKVGAILTPNVEGIGWVQNNEPLTGGVDTPKHQTKRLV